MLSTKKVIGVNSGALMGISGLQAVVQAAAPEPRKVRFALAVRHRSELNRAWPDRLAQSLTAMLALQSRLMHALPFSIALGE